MGTFSDPFSGLTPSRPLTDRELSRTLRLALAAEEGAVQLYEAIADATENRLARSVLQAIAKEERVHAGEFERLLACIVPDEQQLMARGAAEVDTIRLNLEGGSPPRRRGRKRTP